MKYPWTTAKFHTRLWWWLWSSVNLGNPWAVYLEWVNFMIHKLYLNTAIKKKFRASRWVIKGNYPRLEMRKQKFREVRKHWKVFTWDKGGGGRKWGTYHSVVRTCVFNGPRWWPSLRITGSAQSWAGWKPKALVIRVNEQRSRYEDGNRRILASVSSNSSLKEKKRKSLPSQILTKSWSSTGVQI